MLKSIFNCFNPLRPNLRKPGEYYLPEYTMGPTAVKYVTSSSMVLLTLILTTFTILGFTGVLPIGIVGSSCLAAGAGVMGVIALLYGASLGLGQLRAILIIESWK